MINILKTKSCFEVELQEGLEDMLVLFATGIVNPNGPTFNVYFYLDSIGKGESKKLYQLNIHPTSESIQEVAEIGVNSTSNQLEEISFYDDLFGGSLPTLFLRGTILGESIYQKLIEHFINFSQDSLRTYNFLLEYEGRPVERVSAEINNAVSDLLEKKQEKRIGFFERFFGNKKSHQTSIDIKKMVGMLTKESNVIKEIKALFMAYNGSIQNVIPSGMVQINFEEFGNFFTNVVLECDIDLNKVIK